MSEKKRYNFLRILLAAFWVVAGTGTIVLLVAAMNKKNSMRCKSVEITIKGVQNNFFIDKDEVKKIITQMNNGKLVGVAVSDFNLQMMEAALKKNEWIKSAELFFDNNEHLKVEVYEREPVARVFTDKGNSFFVDSSIHVLPLSEKASARIPVFTGFVETSTFSKADSSLMKDMTVLGNYIMNNEFWMAQIEQVDIQPGHTFDLITKIGNQVINFGTVEDYEQKFENLMLFYKKVLSKTSWNSYSRINVKYKGQIVAVKRDAADIATDSLRTIQIMQAIVANTQARVNDSLSNIQLVAEEQQDLSGLAPAERDELNDGTVENDPVINKPASIIPRKDQPVEKKTIAVTTPNIVKAAPTVVKPVTKAVTKSISKTEPKAVAKAPVKQPVKTVAASPKKTTNKQPELKSTAVKKTDKKNEKPKAAPKAIPKAVMPPKNDY